MITSMDLAHLVQSAAEGSPRAWAELVDRFQDRAMAIALGWSGRWEDASDIAQEAFRMAFVGLADLRDPAAFESWFGRLVRTASSRARRVRQLPTVALDSALDVIDDAQPEPLAAVIAAEEAAVVRSAIEGLPQHERVVVALFYLADMSYPEIARFLDIGVSAAKKRGFSARRRLKELLPMAAELLSVERPSSSGELRDTVLLFAAIHRRDADAVQRLLRARPTLALAEEDWTPAEAADAELAFSRHATALIRVAETGSVRMARLLVGAGAPIDGRCRCAGGETPLWAAAVTGHTEMVRYLLSLGADPNAAAFRGATALHVAQARNRSDIVRLLLAAGADPERCDVNGRSTLDWARTRRPKHAAASAGWLWTGIRVLDLCAPIRRGSRQWWPAAYGLGQFILTIAVASSLTPDEIWYIGFDQRHMDAASVRHGLEESGASGHVHLASRDLAPAERRRRLDETVLLLSRSTAHKVVICVVDEGHAHDVDVVLPRLSADQRVLTTIVVAPFKGTYAGAGGAIPEGFDLQVVFDRRRAMRHDLFLLPALDPILTASRAYPSEEHRHLAEATREILRSYDELDPELTLEVSGVAAGDVSPRAQHLIQYFAQHLSVGEPFSSEPADYTGSDQLIAQMTTLLNAAK